jgi:hypothetical protein
MSKQLHTPQIVRHKVVVEKFKNVKKRIYFLIIAIGKFPIKPTSQFSLKTFHFHFNLRLDNIKFQVMSALQQFYGLIIRRGPVKNIRTLARSFSSKKDSEDEKMKDYLEIRPKGPPGSKCTQCADIDNVRPADTYPIEKKKAKGIHRQKPRVRSGPLKDIKAGPIIKYSHCNAKPRKCVTKYSPPPDCHRILPPTPCFVEIMRAFNLDIPDTGYCCECRFNKREETDEERKHRLKEILSLFRDDNKCH